MEWSGRAMGHHLDPETHIANILATKKDLFKLNL